ncbi:MAG: hypothetical protein SOZ65_05540 [Erysipelotrichaceae bacterium]|nr:hypothetical protein [Erysipelotrichaceae bacterium]
MYHILGKKSYPFYFTIERMRIMGKYSISYLLKDIDCDDKTKEEIIDDYLFALKQQLIKKDKKEVKDILLSELNYQQRGKLMSCRCYDMNIKEGDLCYIDFGKAYNQETGYMHFGLVIRIFNSKALVIPMTSNSVAYNSAYDRYDNPEGITHLMRLGKVDGLFKYSVLFLNDAKFINTARIIDVKSHINVNGKLFNEIMLRFRAIIH